MTPESQRIAIAEACGFIYDKICDCWRKDRLAYFIGDPSHFLQIPDYLNDLNAMHEAEKTLNPIQAAEYTRMLTSTAWQSEQPVFAPMTAKADQRAEAFLRTLNLWKE